MGAKLTIVPDGDFSLEAAAAFGFGPNQPGAFDGRFRLAFALDGLQEHAGVLLRQSGDGSLHGTVSGSDDLATVERQVRRVLSLDHDGREWQKVGERDPVIG